MNHVEEILRLFLYAEAQVLVEALRGIYLQYLQTQRNTAPAYFLLK